MTSSYRTFRRTLYFFSYKVLGGINLVEIKCKNISSQEVVQMNLSGFDSALQVHIELAPATNYDYLLSQSDYLLNAKTL